jgi:streptogramin lyase
MASDLQGRLWTSGGRGIERLGDGNWEVVLEAPSAWVLEVDARGQLWLGLDWNSFAVSLELYDGVALRSLPDGPVLKAVGVAADPRGGVWVGAGDLIQCFDRQLWSECMEVSIPNVGSAEAEQIAVNSRGEMWVGGSSRLLHWDGDTWQVLSESEGLAPGCGIAALLLDGQQVWVGHKFCIPYNEDAPYYSGSGISHWDGTQWRAFTPANAGLPESTVTGLAKDARGRLWAGFRLGGYGVSYYDGATWTHVPFSREGLGGPLYGGQSWEVDDVAAEPSGALWFVGYGFVSRYDGTNWESWYSDTTGIIGHGLLADREGRVWLYGNGLACYEDGAWRQVPVTELSEPIRQMAEDASGQLWLVTEAGKIWAYDPPREVESTYLPLVELRELWRGEPTFKAFPFARQTGVFTCTFEARPLQAAMDGVTGLCAGEAFSFADLAAIVRFNSNGRIDARDGGAYRAEQDIPYTTGTWYRFRLVVDIPAHRYDAFVTAPDGQTQVIGQGLAFRSEQSTVPYLDHWALWSGVGQHQVRQLQVQ